jgi:hypothetical protein
LLPGPSLTESHLRVNGFRRKLTETAAREPERRDFLHAHPLFEPETADSHPETAQFLPETAKFLL